MYTPDEDKLILSAKHIQANDLPFMISLSSIDFTPESEFFIGTLNGHRSTSTFTAVAYYPELDTKMQNAMRIYVNKEGENAMAIMPTIPKSNYVFIEPPPQNGSCIFLNPMIRPGAVRIDFGLTIDGGNISCTVQQKQDDEFIIDVVSPISLFQGFCIALSTIHTLSKKNSFIKK